MCIFEPFFMPDAPSQTDTATAEGVHTTRRSNGNVYASAFYTESDLRTKQDVGLIVDAMDVISGMEGVTYTWKHTNEPSCGFIAQQIRPVNPLFVNDRDPENLRIEYTRIIPYLVEAVKTLKRELDECKTKVKKEPETGRT